MRNTLRARGQRGNVTLLAVIVLMVLGTLGVFTTMSVQGGNSANESDRFHTLAGYAAESGGAVAMDYLRKTVSSSTGWTALISASNTSVQTPLGIPGNTVQDGSAGNLFDADVRGWYTVEILNNRDDAGFVSGNDNDIRVIIRSTGHGPNGSVSVLEWDVSGQAAIGTGRPCAGYAQRGISEDGAGRNDCLGTITQTSVTTFRPGGP